MPRGIPTASPRTPPFAEPQNPGNQMDIAPSADFNPDEQRLRELLAHPPQEGVKNDGTKIGGLRRVLGEIAQNVGPLIGGPAVAGIGQKLLNPGLEKWNGDVARAQGLAQLSQTAEARHNLQINRDLMRQQADQTQADREQNALTSFEGKVPGTRPVDALPPSNQLQSPEMFRQGVDNIGRVGLPMNQTNLRPQADSLQVGQPAAMAPAPTSIPGTTVEDQVGPGYGVQRMPVPSSKGKQQVPYAVPTPEKVAQNAADAEALKRDAQKTEEVTPEMEAAAADFKLAGIPKAGTRVTPTQWNNMQTTLRDLAMQRNKPPGAPTAEGEKIKFQAIAAKLAAEGQVSGAQITDVRQMLKAVQSSKTLTPDEKNAATAYLAANTTPAATGTNTTVRVEGMGAIREMPVIDTKNGNSLIYLNANDINRANQQEPGRYVPTGPGIPAMNKTALLEDIRGSINQTRQTLAAVPEFSASDKATIALALRDRDPKSAVSQLIGGAAGAHLTPPQQEYLISLVQLHEQALAMRSVLGAGQGSDDLRAAILRTIPGPSTPNKAYAAKQLDAFEQTLNRLSRGVPSVPLKGGNQAPSANPGTGPAVGTTEGGYRFKGGDPGKRENWEKVQ